VGHGDNLTPVIHVRDVASGAVLAAERGIPGETYLLIGGSYPMGEIRRLVVKTLETSPRYPYVPVWLAWLGAWCLETMAQLTNRTPLVSRRNIASTVADRVFNTEKAKCHLGFAPQVKLEESIADAVTWYKMQGMV
jgi:dihydroflavonol-4-reductase